MIAWAILLFIAGMVLILAEFIVPGLICGILGGILVLASGIVAVTAYPDYILFITVAEVIGVCLSIVLGMYLLARTRAGKHLVLSDSQQQDAGWVAADSNLALVGAEGKAFTPLRPAGSIMVDGKRIDAVANGSFIEKGSKIRVLEVHGSRVVVEKMDLE